MNLRRPNIGEFDPYYEGYINQVSENDFLSVLKKLEKETVLFLENIPAEKWEYKYAPGKWSIKESVIHVLDTERVFAYRALRIARNDKTPLPGFDQDFFVPHSNANSRTPESIIEEYKAVRNATIHLFQHFTSEQLDRLGTGSGKPISVLALGFITAGHEIHHLNIFTEKYL